MRGAPGRAFNLLSTPALSVNAEFTGVPERFRAEDITDTVLGSIGLSYCSVRGGAVSVVVDASTGNVTVSAAPPAADAARRAAAAAYTGAKLFEERYVCDLRRMDCLWEPLEYARPTVLPLVDMRFSRLKLRTAREEVTISRHAVVSYADADAGGGGGGGAGGQRLDCKSFAQWPAAAASCDELRRGVAPAARRDEWALMLVMPSLEPHNLFYFMQFDVPVLRYAQPQVHGLLGQRALSPAPADPAIGGEPETITAGVGARGGASLVEAANARFGHQGEGAIFGRYDQYLVPTIADHGYTFGRFSCACGGAAGAPCAAPPNATVKRENKRL